MISIVAAMDKVYFDKSTPLFNSLDKNAKGIRKCILCIGFEPEQKREGYEYRSIKLHKMKSFRKGFPSNRDFYVCAEGGEFLAYFDFEPEEVIIHIDADMILQREFTSDELDMINEFKDGEVGGSFHSIPTTSLREEHWRLRPESYYKVKHDFPGDWSKPIFNCGLIIANFNTYVNISEHYLSNVDKMIECFDHHAAGQWLMNYVVHHNFKFRNLGYGFHNGEWFLETGTDQLNNKLYYHGNPILFNHTKYLKEWSYE